MKYIIAIIIVIGAFLGLRYLTGEKAPSVAGLETKLKTYIESGALGNCNNGKMTVNIIKDVSLGDYVKEFGYWPVYANYESVCREGSNTTTYNGLTNADKKIAVTFARKGSDGQIEFLIPSIMNQAQNDIQNEINKMFPK